MVVKKKGEESEAETVGIKNRMDMSLEHKLIFI